MPRILLSAMALLVAAMPFPALAKPLQKTYYPHPGGKPFSRAVRVGDMVFVSGAVGTAADGSFPADFEVQATKAMENVAANLSLAGATMDDVYKCSVAMIDMSNFAAFNSVYQRFFKPEHLPVRMAVGVVSLRGAAVEVQCEAALGK